MDSTITELDTVTVHSDEAGSMVWNPATHIDTKVELPDGNMMLHVRRKDEPKREDTAGPEIAG